jgi:hypothetical protein
LLAVLVFGSTAWAFHEPQYVNVDTQQVTLGPGGSVVLTRTITCEGRFILETTVKQRSTGNEYNTASSEILEECTDSPVTLQSTLWGRGPYHNGTVSVVTDVFARYYDPDTGHVRQGWDREVKELRISK